MRRGRQILVVARPHQATRESGPPPLPRDRCTAPPLSANQEMTTIEVTPPHPTISTLLRLSITPDQEPAVVASHYTTAIAGLRGCPVAVIARHRPTVAYLPIVPVMYSTVTSFTVTPVTSVTAECLIILILILSAFTARYLLDLQASVTCFLKIISRNIFLLFKLSKVIGFCQLIQNR